MGEQTLPAIEGVTFETGLISAVGLYVTVVALPQLIHHGCLAAFGPELLLDLAQTKKPGLAAGRYLRFLTSFSSVLVPELPWMASLPGPVVPV